jgi:hypothetical protein
MSNYWDVFCRTCSKHHGCRINHGEEDILWLIKHRDAFAALARAQADGYRGTRLEVRFGADGYINPAWFAAHAGHDLAARDEYGAFAGQCAEYVTCACGHNTRCKKALGHEGEHDPKAVA